MSRKMKFVDKIGKSLGLEIRRFPNRLHRNRLRLLKEHGVNAVLDVGANKGQYALEMREIGYSGLIHSFEPVTEAFQILESKAKGDNLWNLHKVGVGDSEGKVTINVASNLASSSVLKLGKNHLEAAPSIEMVKTEQIVIKKLDALIEELSLNEHGPFYLKIDTQGYEAKVLRGAEGVLESGVVGLQIEMSLVELYEGEMLYQEMIDYVGNFGFTLYSIEPGLINLKTGQMMQFDGIFYKG